MTDRLTAALCYASRGWPVLPLHHPTTSGPKTGPGRAGCSCGKATCDNQGKHPRNKHGATGATCAPAVITRWWKQWPNANIGLATGVAFDVLDLDGIGALDSLDDAAPNEPAVVGPMVVTGRGLHIYLQPTGAGNRASLLPGCDWRGRGGYVVAAGSNHPGGTIYRWGEIHGIDEPLQPCPAWLARIVRREGQPPASGAPRLYGPGTRYGQRALEGELGALAIATEDNRNDALVRAAFRLGQLVAGGELDPAEVAGALLTVAERIGLTEDESVRTITSGMKSGMEHPRRTVGR